MRKRNSVVFLFATLLVLACDYHLRSEPPLHRAAYKGDLEEMTRLLRGGADVNSRNSEGATPLHWAAFKGKLEAAELLLQYGADVNALTKKNSTPLRLAETHKKVALVALLKARGGVAN